MSGSAGLVQRVSFACTRLADPIISMILSIRVYFTVIAAVQIEFAAAA